jgi:hypothetical protein
MIKPKQARGPARWTKQVRFDIEFAKRMVLEQGRCDTILVVHRRGQPNMIMRAPTDLSKDGVALYLRALCIAEDAEGFAFISEAWMRAVGRRHGETEAEHNERAYAVAPSEAEDRIEVVIAEIVYRDDGGERRTMHETREIVRDAAGKPVSFRRTEHHLGGEVDRSEGRWVEVLTPEPPTAEERASAVAALKTLAEMGFGIEKGTMQ